MPSTGRIHCCHPLLPSTVAIHWAHPVASMASLQKRRRILEDAENIDPNECSAVLTCACQRIARIGWTEADLLAHPVGVHVAAKDAQGGVRHHAIFGARRLHEPWKFIGCYESITSAAAAWDEEARRRGISLVNRPHSVQELSVLHALPRRIASIERSGPEHGFPYVTTDAGWRERQMLHVLDQQCGASSSLWASASSLQQADHWHAPGNLLCFSFNPHVFETRKARSCAAGWMETSHRLSAVEVLLWTAIEPLMPLPPAPLLMLASDPRIGGSGGSPSD